MVSSRNWQRSEAVAHGRARRLEAPRPRAERGDQIGDFLALADRNDTASEPGSDNTGAQRSSAASRLDQSVDSNVADLVLVT